MKRIVISVLAGIFLAATATAAPILVEFEGEVTENPFGVIEVGDQIQGSLRYESSSSPVLGDPSRFEAIFSYSFEIGGFSYEMSGVGTIFVSDDVGGSDSLEFFSGPGTLDGPPMSGLVPESVSLLLAGADPSFLTLPDLPTQFDQDDFSSSTFAFSFGPSGPTGQLRTVSAAPVPEPSAALLFSLGTLVFTERLRRQK